jgi:uncharacterized protein YutE (UPF0331/DUF86 family)
LPGSKGTESVEDTKVVETRLRKLDDYQRSLRQLQQVNLDEYLGDDNIQTIVERKLQLSIQVCIDIASYLLAHLGLRPPDELRNVFETLGEEGIIPPELAARMAGMIAFRNILVHGYLDVNPRIVHSHLTTRLGDFDDFARAIVTFLSRHPH